MTLAANPTRDTIVYRVWKFGFWSWKGVGWCTPRRQLKQLATTLKQQQRCARGLGRVLRQQQRQLHVGEAELEQLQKTLKNVAKERASTAIHSWATTTAKLRRSLLLPLSAAVMIRGTDSKAISASIECTSTRFSKLSCQATKRTRPPGYSSIKPKQQRNTLLNQPTSVQPSKSSF